MPFVLKVQGIDLQTFSRKESANLSLGLGSSGIETLVDDIDGSQKDSMKAEGERNDLIVASTRLLVSWLVGPSVHPFI